MDKEEIKKHFGNTVYNTTTVGLRPNDEVDKGFDILFEIAVKGPHKDISWQDVYRRIIKDLERSIPALEAAGIK